MPLRARSANQRQQSPNGVIPTPAESAPVTNRVLTRWQLREDGIEPMLVLTFAAGMLLILVLAPQFLQPWHGGLLGLVLALLPLLAALVRREHPVLCAGIVIAGWFAVVIAATLWLPQAGVSCLLALPVGLATLFIGLRVGLGVGLLATLAAAATEGAAAAVPAPPGWGLAAFAIWGVFCLMWLALQPAETAFQWFWHSYEQARRELELSRDVQMELKQAVKDLAEANTQMARLNQILHAARQAAEEAERVKAEFAANVSHELRTPLNMIIGFSEMILNAPTTYGRRLPPVLLADVAAIHRNSEHLTGLINDVLDISQVEARRMTLSKEWVSLAEIIESAVLAIRPLLDSRGLYLRVATPVDPPTLYCDRTRIRQVLLNLLSNAARFTESGGITIAATLEAANVRVTVTDTGPGIAASDLPKLFEPFQQFDGSPRRRQGGSGLGLHISKRFIELHDGKIGVESRPGEGSAFWFVLPMGPVEPDASAAGRWLRSQWEPKRHSSLMPKPKLIPRLVVLEPANLLHLAASRYLDDVEIESASSPTEARQLLAAGPAQLLLIRSESSEQQTLWLNEMRDTPYGTPIVACQISEQSLANRLGVVGYLTKPITRERLFAAIDALEVPVRSILLADDNSEVQQLFARMLTAEPRCYRVLQAVNGLQALELMRSRRPDLLLLDLRMPEVDGFGVLEAKKRDPDLADIPALILTALDPAGQPVLIPAMTVTHGGGLSMVEFLRSALALSEALAIPRPGFGPAPAAAASG